MSLLSAFIGVAQMVSTVAQQQAQYEFVLAEASRRKDEDTLARLRTIAPPRTGEVLDRRGVIARFHRQDAESPVRDDVRRIARQGVLFTNAFVTAPSCTPCRSCAPHKLPVHRKGGCDLSDP